MVPEKDRISPKSPMTPLIKLEPIEKIDSLFHSSFQDEKPKQGFFSHKKMKESDETLITRHEIKSNGSIKGRTREHSIIEEEGDEKNVSQVKSWSSKIDDLMSDGSLKESKIIGEDFAPSTKHICLEKLDSLQKRITHSIIG